jgi:hypothetical protein
MPHRSITATGAVASLLILQRCATLVSLGDAVGETSGLAASYRRLAL